MESKLITVPFDVLKAKAIQNGELEGKIVTRDGRNVRVVCWDLRNVESIVALVSDVHNVETMVSYTDRGTYFLNQESKADLFIQIPEYLTFKDGDVLSSGDDVFIFKKIVSNNRIEFYTCNYMSYMLFDEGIEGLDIVNSLRLATEPEKQKLIKALQESNDPRTGECLKKLGVEKSPKLSNSSKIRKNFELKPFDKVLVRDNVNSKWEVDIFRHIIENDNYVYIYSCMCDTWKHCIPYEGNEHLLGTNKSAEE